MRFKTRYTKKMFPFAPGIPWTIKNNKYIVPEIDGKVWSRVLKGKQFVVTCYGGLIESFFSLTYCEALKRLEPLCRVSWLGYEDFSYFPTIQGVAKISDFDLSPHILDDYPTPIFMDAENNAYFNVLNNYIETTSYIPPARSIINKDILLKQIYQNFLLDWDNYKPIMRNLFSKKYDNWKKQNKFYDNSKFIIIFPEIWNSNHDINCLQWTDREIREFATIVKPLGISVVVCSNAPIDIVQMNNPIIKAPLDIEIMVNLISKSWGVLSKTIDFLLMSMIISSKTILMSRNTNGIYDLYKNSDFVLSGNVIFSDKNLNPFDLFKFCEGML